jgi:pimeloyl-ACP methyl ester carboxylesterase
MDLIGVFEDMKRDMHFKFPDQVGTITLNRVPRSTRGVRTQQSGSRIDTDTLARQVPTETVAKQAPAQGHQGGLWSPDHFPWIIAVVWTLLLTGATDGSPFPAMIIACVEIFFFIYNTLLARKANMPMRPERMNRDLIELWQNCLDYSPDGAADWIEGWFYDTPIERLTRQDILQFLAWGSCSTTWDLLTDGSKQQMQTVYALFESRLGHTFPERQPGQAPAAFMRFSIEPFEYKFKPTSYYWVCSFMLGLAGKSALVSQGFTRHRSRVLNYWMRVPESAEARMRTPIVFVHGIGVGLIMYMNLIKALLDNDCPVVLVELPFVSSKLGASEVPSISEQVASVEALCIRWGFEKAFFVGHSYGSVMLSWMAQHLPERIAGLAFIDPVVMMLNLKNVLFNFLYKDDGSDGIADIIGSELGVNIALRRNFWWYRNILWASDLQKHALPTVVCLSENDEIGPARAVEKHISQHAAACSASACSVGARGHGGAAATGAGAEADSVVESYMMDGASHGGFLFDSELLAGLVKRIGEHYAKVSSAQRHAACPPKARGNAAYEERKRRRALLRLRRSKSQERLDALML